MNLIEEKLEKSFELAIQTYKNGNYPIGALLVVNDSIIITGKNKVVTEKKYSYHAEIDIINKSGIYSGKNNKKIIFVTLEPCNNCAKALVDFGIDEVYYILEDPSWGGKNILNLAGIKTTQIKYKYEEYLNLLIDFMQKHGGYNEVLAQYISIKQNGENIYKKELDNFLQTHFINIQEDLPDYRIKKIVYHNTLHYLKTAFYRTPQEKHQLILNGYVADTNRIIQYLQKYFLDKSFKKLEVDFIKNLHKNLFPTGFIQKARDINGNEFIQMVPGEYRKINLYSKTNENKNIYIPFQQVTKTLFDRIEKLNNSFFSLDDILLFLANFSRVHPFGDGNGRLAYILTDFLLIKKGFSPLYLGELKQKDEIGFYKVLDKVYESRDVKYMYEFIEKNQKN